MPSDSNGDSINSLAETMVIRAPTEGSVPIGPAVVKSNNASNPRAAARRDAGIVRTVIMAER
jgi:hypothetical protein